MLQLVISAIFFLVTSLPNSSKFESMCTTTLGGEAQNVVFIIEETSVVLLRKNEDPEFWTLKRSDGSVLTEIKKGNFFINFSDKNNVNGYLIRETEFRDTITDYDYATMKEVIKVIRSEFRDTLSSCKFMKVK